MNDSSGNTDAILAIDILATDYLAYTSRGSLILLAGFISTIFTTGAIFIMGRFDETKTRGG